MTWDPAQFSGEQRHAATLALLEAQGKVWRLDTEVFGPEHSQAMRYAYGLVEDVIVEMALAWKPS
ncbi:hypothetical protein GCM10027289_27720 [Tsukamurella serpentis]